jgi:hypothetical protein
LHYQRGLTVDVSIELSKACGSSTTIDGLRQKSTKQSDGSVCNLPPLRPRLK